MSEAVLDPGLRERKKLATRRRIMSEALRLALDGGLEGLTVEAIAEAADVSPRTFFNYFSCKEDALVRDGGEIAARLGDLVLARPAGEPPMRAVRMAIHDSGLLATENLDRERARARLRLVGEYPSLLPRQLAQYANMEKRFIEALAERLGTDPDDDLRPAMVAAVAVTVLRVSMARWTADDSRPIEQLISEQFDLVEAGL